MSKSESKVGTAIESNLENREEPQRPERRAPSGGLFTIAKPGQGAKVRWGTAIGAGLLALAGTHFVFSQLKTFSFGPYDVLVTTLVPAALMVAAAYGIFYCVGRSDKIVEFLVATEGEMKKVNWSSRREVWGATKVVIVTVFLLGIILALVDLAFIFFFYGIGVLRNVPMFKALFGSASA